MEQYPEAPFGNAVQHIESPDVEALYREARLCVQAHCFTATVMCCRKLLMNVAVSRGAKKYLNKEKLNFLECVNFLADEGFVPPDGKEWVDHICKKGNEANHEIALMNRDDAEELVEFSGMLLKFIYEFPYNNTPDKT